MIAQDAPAQVNDGGRRRDGGLSFTIDRGADVRSSISCQARGGEDEGPGNRTSLWQNTSDSMPQTSRRRPRCIYGVDPPDTYRRCTLARWRRRREIHGAFLFCEMARAQERPCEEQNRRDTTERGKAQDLAPRCADRALLLADAERLENFDHARRVRAAVCRASGRHLQGRAVRARTFWRSRPTTAFRPSSIPPARAGGRSRCSSPAPSCNTSAARPENSIRATSATRVAVDEWLFWQMGGLGPMAGQANHFRRYAPEPIAYAVARYTDEVNRLYGVMNTRLAQHEFLAGRYSIADMACVGWVRLAERHGPGPGAISASQALVRNHPRAAGGQARLRHPHRGGVRGRHARSQSARCSVRPAAQGEAVAALWRPVTSLVSRSATCRAPPSRSL